MGDRYKIPKEEEWYYDHICFPNEDGRDALEDCSQLFRCNPDEEKCYPLSDDSDVDQGRLDSLKDDYEEEHDDREMRKNSIIFNIFIFMQVGR